MADFESIIKNFTGEDGSISAEATAKLAKAISTTVGNEFVDKSRYKAKLEEIDELTGKLQTADDSVTTAEKWKVKYEAIKQEFSSFKADQAKKEAHTAKESAYRALLKAAGISEKRLESVLRVSDVDSVELDENGAVKGADKLSASVKEEWADFIETTEVRGAETPFPPVNMGGPAITKEEIMNISDAEARQQAIAEHHELFGI